MRGQGQIEQVMRSGMVLDVIANTDFLSAVFESLTGYAIAAIDFDGGIIAYNEGAHAIYGYSPEEVIGKANIEILFTSEFVREGRLNQVVTEVLSSNKCSFEGHQVRKNGEEFPAQVLFSPCRDKNDKVVGFIQIAQDITERNKAAEALKRSEGRFRQLIEKSADGVVIIDRDGAICFANPTAEELFQRGAGQLVGSPFGFPALAEESTILELVIPGGNARAVEMYATDIEWNGSPAIMASLHNVTEQKRVEQMLYDLSLNDELTGLYNRRGFLALTEQQLRVTRRLKQEATLLFADMDGLKWINDTLGHEQGDKAIVAAATVLKAAFRDSDIVARMGGDEFAVFMLDCPAKMANTAIDRLQKNIAARNETEGNIWKLALSIGTAGYAPSHEMALAELLDVADKEMYLQKTGRRQPEASP